MGSIQMYPSLLDEQSADWAAGVSGFRWLAFRHLFDLTGAQVGLHLRRHPILLRRSIVDLLWPSERIEKSSLEIAAPGGHGRSKRSLISV